MNLRTVDLNLLVIFQALVAERSASGAAARLGLSPSAVSHALRRLRELFNDDLFTRTAGGLVPTTHALDLAAEIGRGLDAIEQAIEQRRDFDPLVSSRTFTIQIADYVSGFVLPRLSAVLRAEAPGVKLVIAPFSDRLGSSEEPASLQIRLTWGDERPPGIRSQRLLTDSFVVLMRRGHEAARAPMTVEHYASLNHIKVSAAAVGTTIIDDSLANRGLERNVVLTVPHWIEVPSIIERTDLVAVVPARWCQSDNRLTRFSTASLPLDEVTLNVDQCWDSRRDRDPAQRWLRQRIAKIFAGQDSSIDGE